MEDQPVLSGDVDPLGQLAELCGHRWDSHLLLHLAAAAQPIRRAELAAGITRAAGERISDGQLDRTIRRLTLRKLVRYRLDKKGYKVYQLTPPGHQHAARLRALVNLLDPTRDTHIYSPHDHPPKPDTP
jgi:DNA-binding PadR family transcriptional regulator